MKDQPVFSDESVRFSVLKTSSVTGQLHLYLQEVALQRFCRSVNGLNLHLQGVLQFHESPRPIDLSGDSRVL